jgi:hypothetical protein
MAQRAGGGRQQRRAQAERHRFWYVLMPMVAIFLALTAAAGVVIRSNDGTTDEAGGASSAGAGAQGTNTLLLGHRGADGRLDLLLLTGTDGQEASILLFPIATQLEVPSLGPQVLADLPNEGEGGSTSLLQTTVENLLGVRVQKTLMLDDATLGAALAEAQPIPVATTRVVQFDDGTGELFAAGDRRLSAEEATRLLVTPQSGSELDRLITVQDVLDGWLERLQRRPIARATVQIQPDLSALVAAARAKERRTDTLPVESVATGGGERFDPRVEDVARYVSIAFANARIGGKTRPRVEILNGTGAVGLAQDIASQVVPAGGQVTLSGNVPSFGVAKTQVVYYRDEDRDDAQRLLDALDCGRLAKADTAIGVVDVTIIAGADCFRTGEVTGP